MASGQVDACKEFAGQCLSEYDLNGWTVLDMASFDEFRQARAALFDS